MNFDLGARNVMTASADTGIVAEFRALANGAIREPDYAVIRPKWHSDIQWVSANTPATFALFESAFDRMGIGAHVAEYLDLEDQPRLYNGFVLLRTACSKPDFHVDWMDTGNEAFTFITPFDERIRGFGILYEKVTGTIAEYDYRPGEAIIFGDGFVHSTKPGTSDAPVATLCFQFGTDKMKHWDKIMQTAGYQSLFIQQPDGRFARRHQRAGEDRWETLR
jgi:hypothetical protein